MIGALSQRRQQPGALLAALAVAALHAGGCSVSLGPPGDWEPAESIIGALSPELELDRFAARPRSTPLRVVSFNVALGKDTDALYAAFAGDASLAAADILLLQEIEAHPAEGDSRTRRLADRLAMNFVYAPARTEGEGTHGLAILSRLTLGDVEVMQLPYADEVFRARRRIALAATVSDDRDSLRVVNTHLDLRLNLPERIAQFHPVAQTAQEVTLIAGDMNTNPYEWLGPVPVIPDAAGPGSDTAALFDDYVRDQGFDTPAAGIGATQSTAVSDLRLDAIYTRGLSTGAAWAVTEVRVSDHVPIVIDVGLGP